MAVFTYKARDRRGKVVTGSLEGDSRRNVSQQLTLRGLTPVLVKESGAGGGGSRQKASGKKNRKPKEASASNAEAGDSSAGLSRRSGPRIKAAHRLPFLRALSDLIASGMPIGDAVRLLSTRFRDPVLKFIAQRIWEGVSTGLSVSDSMAQMPRVFDTSTVYLIQAGEATGSLKEILRRLVDYLEERERLLSRVKLALAYPTFIFVMALAVLLFCIYVLFPRLESLMLSLGGDLPQITRWLMTGSAFMVDYGIFVFLGIALVVVAFWQWVRTPGGRMTVDRFLLKVPVLGKFLLYSDVLAITQTFSALLENGVTTIDALRMSENVVRNREIHERFREVRPLVADGASISASFSQTECFPDLVLDMIGVGENTGNIVPSLKEVSKQMETQLSNQLRAFTAVITSGVLMAAVAFVGIVAYAIFSAVFSLSAQFS